jgi:cytochrome oxidase assembly protein ShyY1
VTLTLGLWQVKRGEQKEALSLQRQSQPPVQLNGQWLAPQTVYIDNRQMNARQGFFVVTPLALNASEYVLVERGWIARNFVDRKQLADVQTPSGTVSIEVRDLAEPQIPAVMAENIGSERPIVQYVSLPEFQTALPGLNFRGYVRQVGPASEGLLRNWFEPASKAPKHYGYAFQWFALCLAVIALYVWYQWIKK